MFAGFLFGARVDRLAARAAAAVPAAWGETLLPAPTYQDRRQHYVTRLDARALRDAVRAKAPRVRAAVIFAVDQRPADVAALRDELIYSLPRVEIVALRSDYSFESRLFEFAEYYGLTATDKPKDLAEALQMFRERHPTVTILPRAVKSAEDAWSFRDPRLALTSLHFLPRVYVDWADARRRDPRRSNHQDLRDLTYPARDAFRELLQDARFDISDGNAGEWECPDGRSRNFGWHQKWSLAGTRVVEAHCRIHYAVDKGDAANDSRVFVGHCGIHL